MGLYVYRSNKTISFVEKIWVLDLKLILDKTKSHYISVSDAEGKIIDSLEENNFDFKDEISKGSDFFLKSASDFFEKVISEKDLQYVTLSSNETNILFIKDSSEKLVFSIYTKNEISPSIVKFIIEKYARNN